MNDTICFLCKNNVTVLTIQWQTLNTMESWVKWYVCEHLNVSLAPYNIWQVPLNSIVFISFHSIYEIEWIVLECQSIDWFVIHNISFHPSKGKPLPTTISRCDRTTTIIIIIIIIIITITIKCKWSKHSIRSYQHPHHTMQTLPHPMWYPQVHSLDHPPLPLYPPTIPTWTTTVWI